MAYDGELLQRGMRCLIDNLGIIETEKSRLYTVATRLFRQHDARRIWDQFTRIYSTTPRRIKFVKERAEWIVRALRSRWITATAARSLQKFFREVFVVDKNTEQRDDKSKIYLTTENSPELKKKMDKISAELLKRNKNLYKRLANACW